MPWIRIVPLEQASGMLKRQYEAALARAGRIWNIVSIMSLNPRASRSSMDLYATLMQGPSALTRAQREMLAVIVSARNDCVY